MLQFLRRLVQPRVTEWHEPGWENLAGTDWHTRIMSANLEDRLHVKQGRSIVRWTLAESMPPCVSYVKRHYRHSFSRSLLAWIAGPGRSDALQELYQLAAARSLGLRVPRALAAAEWRGPGRLQSVLVIEELAGMIALHEAIPMARKAVPGPVFERWKRTLAVELARQVRLMHDKGLFHRDLYLCHFFIHESDTSQLPASWHGRVALIDFHRFGRSRFLPVRDRIKDLAQLLYSTHGLGLSAKDALAFWRAYRAPGRSRWLRRMIAWKCRRYLNHNSRAEGAA